MRRVHRQLLRLRSPKKSSWAFRSTRAAWRKRSIKRGYGTGYREKARQAGGYWWYVRRVEREQRVEEDWGRGPWRNPKGWGGAHPRAAVPPSPLSTAPPYNPALVPSFIRTIIYPYHCAACAAVFRIAKHPLSSLRRKNVNPCRCPPGRHFFRTTMPLYISAPVPSCSSTSVPHYQCVRRPGFFRIHPGLFIHPRFFHKTRIAPVSKEVISLFRNPVNRGGLTISPKAGIFGFFGNFRQTTTPAL